VPCDLAFGCLVHTGFYASWKEISSRVLQGVKAATAANPTWPIVVTGHSLGGAVATIATPYIRKANLKADLYTSGSPRVGNSVFVKYVTNQAGGEYRLTHEADPFARLPHIIFNYRHTSPEYWLKEPALSSADIKICTGYADVGCNAEPPASTSASTLITLSPSTAVKRWATRRGGDKKRGQISPTRNSEPSSTSGPRRMLHMRRTWWSRSPRGSMGRKHIG